MRVPCGKAAGPSSIRKPWSTTTRQPLSAPAGRDSITSRATEPIDGKASPRNPRVATRSSAPSSPTKLSGNFDVACRSSASAIPSRSIPHPSSITSMPSSPPPASRTTIRPAPASIAFSTSSFNADAGRSTTSPAAMRLTSVSGRRRMMGMGVDIPRILDPDAPQGHSHALTSHNPTSAFAHNRTCER